MFLLGETHGLSEPELDHLTRAAELSDIGRAALPAGLPTGESARAEDRALLAQHPLIAERVLAAAPALAPVARIVRSTYECYDGNGYPDGLAGQDIPLEARIISAGRAFLALADRDESASGQVLDELTAQSGVRLDPFVVDNLHELTRDLRLTEMDPDTRRSTLRRRARGGRRRWERASGDQ